MASTCLFPFFFIQPTSSSPAYKISALSVYIQPERDILNHIEGDLSLLETHSELLYWTGFTSFTRLLFKISLNQQKKLSSHSRTGPEMVTTYFNLVHSLMAHLDELTHHSELKGVEFRKGSATNAMHLCDCNRR